MTSDMPAFNAPDDQAAALAFYISTEAAKPLTVKPLPADIPASPHSQLLLPARPQPQPAQPKPPQPQEVR
jgi:hypothetical protein